MDTLPCYQVVIPEGVRVEAKNMEDFLATAERKLIHAEPMKKCSANTEDCGFFTRSFNRVTCPECKSKLKFVEED